MKYKDVKSQKLVINLIIELIRLHPDLSLPAFNAVFKSLCLELVNGPKVKASMAALIALTWANTIALKFDSDSNEAKLEFSKLMEYQSFLYALAIQSGNEKITEKAYDSIKSFLSNRDDYIQMYFEKFLAMNPAYNIITFLSAILQLHKEKNSDIPLLINNRAVLLDHFVKGLITIKMKPNCHHVTACRIVLETATLDEVNSILLPALQRSMLRNPEVVLKSVGFTIGLLNVDISDSVVDLGKILIENLYSKNEDSRLESLNSIKELAKKCSNVSSIQSLLTQIFSVLGGSDGKITVAEYRINLLQVIEYFLISFTK